MASTLPIGSVLPFAGKHYYNVPIGWLLCDGRPYDRGQYPELFSAIGTAHGAVDNDSFCVPDLRGNFIRGVDGNRGVDPDTGTRTAPAPLSPPGLQGNSGDNVGSIQAYATACASNPMTATIPYLPTSTFGAQSPAGAPDSMCVVNTPGFSMPTNGGGDRESRPVNKAMYYIIKASDVPMPVGMMAAVAGDDGPALSSGWLLCDGTPYGPTDSRYSALFGALSTSHGGDGTTSFYIPDLRGWFIRGAQVGGGQDPDGPARGVARPDLPAGQQGDSGIQVGSAQSAATGRPINPFSSFFPLLPDEGVHVWNSYGRSAGWTNWAGVAGVNVSQGGGDKESRPVNVSVDWLVLADPDQAANLPIGGIAAFAGTDAADPAWSPCDGRTLNQGDYPALYAQIGTTYGAGAGAGSFQLPDYRGVFLRGRDRGAGKDPDAGSRLAPNSAPKSGSQTGDVIGSVQNYATALPNNPFTADILRLPTNQQQVFSTIHDHEMGGEDGNGPIATNNQGGDAETRPVNLYLGYIIRLQ